jgi:MazG family protein
MPERITTLPHPYDRVQRLMEVLRQECPWDREQTLDSLAPCTLEEAYEVLEAVDIASKQGDWKPLQEELGDLLLHIAFYAQLAEEQQAFTLASVFDALVAKMIARHPHVFGDVDLSNASDVLRQWEAIKAEEKSERISLMDGIPPLPALAYAQKQQTRAATVGYDWNHADDVIEKMQEELDEFAAEVQQGSDIARLQDEFGDVLFTLVNLGRKSGLDAEQCLMQSSRKFARRFRGVESLAVERGVVMKESSLTTIDALYQEVKAALKDADDGNDSAH